jgi:hypothetical protein
MTPAQRRFAEEHEATFGTRSCLDDRMVFLYHREAMATSRWLVDDGGHVMDSVRLQ